MNSVVPLELTPAELVLLTAMIAYTNTRVTHVSEIEKQLATAQMHAILEEDTNGEVYNSMLDKITAALTHTPNIKTYTIDEINCPHCKCGDPICCVCGKPKVPAAASRLNQEDPWTP